MKKITLIVAVAAFGLSVSSCKKDYTCSCTYKEEHNGHLDDGHEKHEIKKANKKDAEAACDGHAATLKANPDHSAVKCELK